MDRIRLKIEPVINQAHELHERVLRDLPTHDGLARLAASVKRVAGEAEHVSRHLRRPFGWHRMPAFFLAIALLMLVGWIYLAFFRDTTLMIALPDRDAQELRNRVTKDKRVHFRVVPVLGSREAVEYVERGEVDLAFVQGGVAIPSELPRLKTPNPELVLWFVRAEVDDVRRVKRILTSVAGEGSHSVAGAFVKAWGIADQVQYLYEWKQLTEDPQYRVPDDVDAVFVVKDPADEKTLLASSRLREAGFRLESPDLGARAGKLDYLEPHRLPARYLGTAPPTPALDVNTYSVTTFLVARTGLTPRLLATAGHLLDGTPPDIRSGGFEPNVQEASEFFQGIDAFLGILINIGLAFLALLGWEMMAYRKRFHELNSLISLISVHQSTKDVLGVAASARRSENLLYLSLCSDLLGLISMIAGYYTQENSSLLFNSLPEIIHQRCDGLKINIQLKILHATIESSPPAPSMADAAASFNAEPTARADDGVV